MSLPVKGIVKKSMPRSNSNGVVAFQEIEPKGDWSVGGEAFEFDVEDLKGNCGPSLEAFEGDFRSPKGKEF
ncbi:hypothetical protein L484_025275 [Morus notabilis]|uniref:Uncharacterized protein n=1 Tax=Morus notabilis TaxID=981085 RepID=W9SIT4_9ROSA|nr:hypothetical protein L484_025275 [Morus notabilis]